MLFSSNEDTFETQVQEILPVSVSTTPDKLWPFLEQVERKYIKPLLEAALFADVDRFVNDHANWTSGSGEDEAKTTELVKLIRISELNLAYLVGFDVLNVKLSDGGFQRPESETFKGTYRYQEENLRRYFETTGFNGLDDMLKFVEENIEHFPEFEESTIYGIRKKSIIKDAETFDAICAINRSRIIFLRLQRYMNEVTDFQIKPLLGDEWATLQTELAKDTPDAKYTALVTEIQKPLAFLSVAKLIEKTGTLTDRGLYFEGKNSVYPDDSTRSAAQGESMRAAAADYRTSGEQYLEALKQYLIANEFTSGVSTVNPYSRDNDHKKIFVA